MHWSARYATDPILSAFAVLADPRMRILVRRGYEDVLGVPLRAAATLPVVGRTFGGREPHPIVELPGGERVLLRTYRRGGLLRHLNRTRYFRGHRAFDELRATEAAALGGVRVPSILAAVEKPAAVGYEAILAVSWIDAARDLASWWNGSGRADRITVMERIGEQVQALHSAGISHPDMNLRNVLVSEGDTGPRVHIIDFDRARVRQERLPPRIPRRDLLRLARSARKLNTPLGDAEWAALRRGYGSEWPLTGRLG